MFLVSGLKTHTHTWRDCRLLINSRNEQFFLNLKVYENFSSPIPKSTVFLRVSENTSVSKLWSNGDLSLASSVILFSAFKPQLDKSHSPTSWCYYFSLRVRIFTTSLQIYLQTYSLCTLITCITKEMPSKTDM